MTASEKFEGYTLPEPLRMDAYYYSFDRTGVYEIDCIFICIQ